MDSLERLKQRLQVLLLSQNIAQLEGFKDQLLGAQCCELALIAAEAGNYGVGAILVDNQGETLASAGNQVFAKGYHSSAHAEMCVLDRFEREFPDWKNRAELTLFVSLEPCPMCLVRSMLAGIGNVKYLAKDTDGGMLTRLNKLPPAWRNLAQMQSHKSAKVSPELQMLASEISQYNIAAIRQKVVASIRGE